MRERPALMQREGRNQHLDQEEQEEVQTRWLDHHYPLDLGFLLSPAVVSGPVVLTPVNPKAR